MPGGGTRESYMRSVLHSPVVVLSLVCMAVVLVLHTCQLDRIEQTVLDLKNSPSGVGVQFAAPSSAEDLLNDPENLLTRSRPLITATNIKRGGTLRKGIGVDPRGLNPYVADGADVAEYHRYIGNYLASRHPDDPDKWGPELAAKVTTPDQGLTYIIHLRKGVLWHKPTVDWASGKYKWLEGQHEFNSDDVVFAFEIIRNNQISGRVSSMRTYFEALKDVEAIDRYTLKVTFNKRTALNFSSLMETLPMPRWLYMFDEEGKPFDQATWGLKFNEHWYNRKAIGTGPYTFVGWEPSVHIELARNAHYFGETPAFDRVFILIVKDQNAWIRKLKMHEVDIMYLQPEQYRTAVMEGKGPLLGQKNIETKRMSTLSYTYIAYNQNTPFFSDKRVRQAMTLSFDRVGMIKNIFYDLYHEVSGPFAKEMPCYDQTIAPMPYDLELAKKKLDTAGWKDTDGDGIRDKVIDGKKIPFAFTLTIYGSSDEYATVANVWREALLQIGVRMDPRPLEWSTMLKKVEEREFDAYTSAWAMDWDVDLMQIWHSSEADKPQSSNRIGFKNKEADRIAEALRAEMDPTKRVALCHEFHKLAHEEQPYTFFYENVRPVLYWNDLNTPEFSKVWPQFDIRYWSFRGKNP